MVETITPVVHGRQPEPMGRLSRVHAMRPPGPRRSPERCFRAGTLLGAPWGVAGLGLVAASAVLYVARELGRRAVPQLRRQVPDWWRTFFPPHVAAFLYGSGSGPGS